MNSGNACESLGDRWDVSGRDGMVESLLSILLFKNKNVYMWQI